MIKFTFAKKPILVQAGEPMYIRREANSKHNELTLVIAKYAIPLVNILPKGTSSISRAIVEAACKAAAKFQNINFEFNRNPNAPAFLFTVKAKTIRRGNDKPSQAIGDLVAITKANIQALSIAKKTVAEIRSYVKDLAAYLDAIDDKLENHRSRERGYMEKV